MNNSLIPFVQSMLQSSPWVVEILSLIGLIAFIYVSFVALKKMFNSIKRSAKYLWQFDGFRITVAVLLIVSFFITVGVWGCSGELSEGSKVIINSPTHGVNNVEGVIIERNGKLRRVKYPSGTEIIETNFYKSELKLKDD